MSNQSKQPKEAVNSNGRGTLEHTVNGSTTPEQTAKQSPASESHKFLEIWENGSEWRAQMVNYIGHFKTKEHAEKFVNAVRVFRKSQGELK